VRYIQVIRGRTWESVGNDIAAFKRYVYRASADRKYQVKILLSLSERVGFRSP
jgi:hypothetical protein